MAEKEIIEILISRYLKNDLDPKEIEFIESWINSSEQNRVYFERIRRVLEEQSIHFPEQSVQKARERIKTIMLGQFISQRKKSNQLTGVFSVLIILTSSLAFYFANQSSPDISSEFSNQFTMKTGKGENTECILPDSTHIWLNSNSQICYKLKAEGKLRSVEIKGEAFFDVAKKKNIPFEVLNGNIQVKVFGTRFNFKSEGSDVQVTLEEGSLGIYNSEQKEIARLVPGVQAVVNQSGILSSLEKVDPVSISEWRTGTFEFRNESLDAIAHRMTEIYGVNITIADKVLEGERFRCVINSNKSILHTLELLKQTSDIDYSIKGSEVILRKRR